MVIIKCLFAILSVDWHIASVLQVIWKIMTLQTIHDSRESDFRVDRKLAFDNLIEKPISFLFF